MKRSKAIAGRTVLVLIASLALAAASTASHALGTPEQRAACTPDVFRLCASEIPNVGQIIACMKRNRSQLSDACRTVFLR